MSCCAGSVRNGFPRVHVYKFVKIYANRSSETDQVASSKFRTCHVYQTTFQPVVHARPPRHWLLPLLLPSLHSTGNAVLISPFIRPLHYVPAPLSCSGVPLYPIFQPPLPPLPHHPTTPTTPTHSQHHSPLILSFPFPLQTLLYHVQPRR